jgi:hypothetical protein
MIRKLTMIAVGTSLLSACGQSEGPTKRVEREDPHASMSRSGMASGTHDHTAGGAEVNLGLLRLTAPDGWVRRPPQSRIVLAEFGLPRVEGDVEDGRLTVTVIGGTVEQNIARWKGQFGGNPEEQSQEQIEIAGLQVTVIDFLGTYNAQHGMDSPITQLPDYRMRAAIVKVAGRQVIIKAYGPQRTMAEHEDEFEAFIRSLVMPQRQPAAPAAEGETETPKPEATAPPQDEPQVGPEPEKPESANPAATDLGPEEAAPERPAPEQPALEQPDAVEEPEAP